MDRVSSTQLLIEMFLDPIPHVEIEDRELLGLGMHRCPSSWHAVRDDGVLVHADDDFAWSRCPLRDIIALAGRRTA